MKKIFYFGLLGLAAGQSACTFADYAAEQDGKCVAAPSDGSIADETCPSLTAGTPTLYGSVKNADNEIASVFADYLNMDRGSIYVSKSAFNSAFKVVDVVNEDIEYCTNAETLGSENGHCLPVDGRKADELFEVVGASGGLGGTVKLKSKVDMKSIGGPRHMIKLTTTTGCFVYYKVYIFPDTGDLITAEAQLSDTNSILEHLELPTQSLTNNGLNPLFELKIYDNVFCAIRDECRLSGGICLGGTGEDAEPLDLWTVTATNSTTINGNLIDPKIVGGDVIEVNDSGVDEMARFWYSKDESGVFQKFAPGDPLCTISVQFAWDSYVAVSLAEDTSLTEILSIEKISIGDAFNNVLLANANIQYRDKFNTDKFAKFSQFETSAISESVDIADVNDLPAIFVDDITCASYTDCKSSLGDKYVITVEYDECKNKDVLLTVGTNISIVDGDRLINAPVSLDSGSFSSSTFELSGDEIKCKTVLPPGEHSFTLTAKENGRDDRSSSLTVVVNVNAPTVDWDTIIDLPEITGFYEYIDAPSYVRNIEDDSAFTIGANAPPGQKVILILDTPGFTLTENNELLKTGGSSSTRATVSLVAKLLLLENSFIIAEEDAYDLGDFNIEEKIFTTTEVPVTTTQVFTTATTELVTCAPCPTMPPTTTELPITSTCPEVICPTPEPCPTNPPPTTQAEDTTTACPACPIDTTTECPVVPTTSCPTAPPITTTSCPECPTVTTTACPVESTTACPVCPTVTVPVCPEVTTTDCPVVTTTACPECPSVTTTACPVVPTTVCPVVSTTICPVVTTTACPTFSPSNLL